jgi:hypothetical protein
MRGWYPANRMLLLHPELVKDDISKATPGSAAEVMSKEPPQGLNLTNGFSNSCIKKILQDHVRKGGIAQNQRALKDGERIVDMVKKGRRVTSGFLVAHGSHNTNDKTVQEAMRWSQKRKQMDMRVDRQKKKKVMMFVRDVVNKLRTDKPNMQTWNNKDCCSYLRYKKRKGDDKLPKGLHQLQQRCAEVAGRASPDVSDVESDAEEELHLAAFMVDLAGNTTGTASCNDDLVDDGNGTGSVAINNIESSFVDDDENKKIAYVCI